MILKDKKLIDGKRKKMIKMKNIDCSLLCLCRGKILRFLKAKVFLIYSIILELKIVQIKAMCFLKFYKSSMFKNLKSLFKKLDLFLNLPNKKI